MGLSNCGLIVLVSAVSAVSAQQTPSDFGIFDWIHNSPGGYFNQKQEFRFEVAGDASTVAGIFAKETIRKGEILVKVPWDLMLKSDDEEEVGQMCCGTVDALAREMKLGAESKFAPYVEYLNAQPEGQIPSAWSEPGKNLLRKIVGGKNLKDPELPPSEPTEWLDIDWYENCEADPDDKVAAKAALLVVQRSDDYYMIPAYDMYNHRNGKRFLNTETITTEGVSHVTKATKDIPAGTQIYISYNKCKECEGRKTEYGTPEILRDYGFVERYPQIWHFMDGDFQYTIDKMPNDDDKYSIKWYSKRRRPDINDYERFLVFLQTQIRRLRRIRNLSKFDPSIEQIPKHELESIWEFHEAYIVSMSVAIEATEEEFIKKEKDLAKLKSKGMDGTCSIDSITVNASHYDLLDWEFDDLDYSSPSCDNTEIMNFNDYDLVESLKTNYQQLNFAIHPDDGDVCMDIEDIVQICSCYRPQYHEYVVHAAARFVDKVKRVIFIGGGDSMLLHETLKYPDLELVVGLELDQTVVRKSFKYFKSQPHFDDERVEWWFGDATKSLLLLPKEYWQSFDLVLVDLSETVMSFSVTEELDVFDALGLLLKPDGVMVKNELYMEKFSDVFDYSTQIYYESPIICSQALVMGSNSVDFIHGKPKDHKVETLLYEPLVTAGNHLDYLHDYRKNDARVQGKCGELKVPEIPTGQSTAAGILGIVNAEQTDVPLRGNAVAEKIREVIEAQGFSMSSVPVFDNGFVYAIMKEGYIVARVFPDDEYCAFDINLWGKFHKFKELQTSLVEAVGSKLVSAYRVVVGGMYGSSTWKEDQALIGPQIVQTRNCEEKIVSTDTTTTYNEMISVALEESMSLALKGKLKALAICGVEGKGECLAADLLPDLEQVASMNKIFTCAGLDEEDVSEETMMECEAKILEQVMGLVGTAAKTRFNLIVADAAVPYPMLQILNSIFGTIKDRKALIRKQHIFIVLSTNPDEEIYRQHFLDRYRKQYHYDPVARGHVLLRGQDRSVGVGIISAGDEQIAYRLESYVFKLQEIFSKVMERFVSVELQAIQGGEFPYIDDYNPQKFKQSDYESKPGLDQFYEQQSLGQQSIFQLVPAEGVESLEMSSTKLKEILRWGLDHLHFEIRSHHESTDVGDGCVQILVCNEGSAIGVWDGQNHVDINFFTYEDLPKASDEFIEAVLGFTAGTAVAALRDDQPRGVGRVINFPADMRGEDEATS